MGINDNPLGVSGTTISGLGDQNGALYQFLKQTSGGSSNAQRAIDLAGMIVPQQQEANPWEAAFQYFAEMGRQASQPGATALGAAAGSMQVPLDYLNAKKKEKRETDRARMQTALTLGASLKPAAGSGGGYDWVVDKDGNTVRLSNAEIMKRQAAGQTYTPWSKESTTADNTRMTVVLRGSTDDPETPVDESITSILRGDFDPEIHFPIESRPKDEGGATYGKPDFYMVSNQNEDGTFTDPIETALTPKQFSQLPTDGTVRVTSVPKAGTSSTYKEQKFYKLGQDSAVIKNETDAALFAADGWVTVPPTGWKPPPDSVNAAEVKSSKILDSGVVVSILSDNTVTVRNGLGELLPEGQSRADAIKAAEQRGIEIQGDRSQQRGLGSEAAKLVATSYEKMFKINASIVTLEDAKRALESGAQTGYFAQFLPDISTSAVELKNVKLRLGLDVVASIVFGALSEKELNVALDTGLPESMDEDFLKGWVQERIDAKKKLLTNLQEVTSFLARGNSIGDWMVELDKRATTSQEEITPLATEISNMSIEEIYAIDLQNAGLSNAELKAYIKRANELRAK
jgi:hypothetical protein